ncbi:MAG: transposase [Cytophagaceae bacterium]|nr:MAG: transposase [Cytophagaceae bacterium]
MENITSDRKLLELAKLHLGIRAFLGYELNQPLPWHSTLCRTRHRVNSTLDGLVSLAQFKQLLKHYQRTVYELP